MSCCPHCLAAEKLFNAKVAAGDLRRYRRRGPDATTRLLLEEIRARPAAGRTLLDIGGGVGVIGQELLTSGFDTVTQVDAAPAYLETARRAFAERGWSDRVRLVEGDFVALGAALDPAAVVTLDRVVCCYPDYDRLLGSAARLARELLAFSYPRDRWYVRLVAGLGNAWRRLVRDPFRTFVHPPARLRATVEALGFVAIARTGTLVWQVDVYQLGHAATA